MTQNVDNVHINVAIPQVLNSLNDLSISINRIDATLSGFQSYTTVRLDSVDRKLDKLDDRVDGLYKWIIGILATAAIGEPIVIILLKVFHVI